MRIPTRFIITGDQVIGNNLRPICEKLISFLKHRMTFSSLPTDQLKPIKLPGGITIDCSVNYGLAEVKINIPKMAKDADNGRECLCLPHFSIGIITAVDPEDRDNTFLLTGRFKYDILICAKSLYLVFKGAYDANFGKYYVGQFVMVTIGAEMDEWEVPLDCDRHCLAQKPRFDTLIISPIHVPGEMQEWKDVLIN